MSKEKHGNDKLANFPVALSVVYSGNRIQVETTQNWGFSFAPGELAELDGVEVAQLADVRILGSGQTIEWTTLGIHISVGTIIGALLGEEFLITEGNRRVARRTSAKKALSSAENGRRGGRPSKKQIN